MSSDEEKIRHFSRNLMAATKAVNPKKSESHAEDVVFRFLARLR